MGIFKKAALVSVVSSAVLLTGCGGGGGTGSSDSGSGGSATQTGVFLDAAVKGIAFSASPSGLSGTTNADGEFSYQDGDTVTFSVGNIALGSASASGIVTPNNLASAIDETDLPVGVSREDVALNLAMFLQTFDSDGNPDNGIDFDADVASAAADASVQLNFQKPSNEFAADSNLAFLASQTEFDIVTPEQAAAHSNATLQGVLAGSWLFDSTTEPGSEMAVLTLFDDGKYVLGIDHIDPDCSDGLEYGSYSVNAQTMELIVGTPVVDSTGPGGDCGFYEDGSGESLTLSVTDDRQFSISPENESGLSIVLDRIDNDDITGTWVLDNGSNNDVEATVTLLDNDRYMVAQVFADGSGQPSGIETGSYSLDSNNVMTTTPEVDTNGQAGLSHQAPGTTYVVESSGMLAISDGDEVFYLSPALGQSAESGSDNNGSDGDSSGSASGNSVTGHSTVDTYDLYYFTVPEGTSLLTVTLSSMSADANLSVRNNGGYMGVDNLDGSAEESGTAEYPMPGDSGEWTICVDGWEGNTDYQLDVQLTPYSDAELTLHKSDAEAGTATYLSEC